jgi:magnesium transporter
MAELEDDEALTLEELDEAWSLLSSEERLDALKEIGRADADDFFLQLNARDQAALVLSLPPHERRAYLRLLPPDDAADVVQECDDDEREELMALLDEPTRIEVNALLAYAEDEAGGLMSPRFARVRPAMTVQEAISYLRMQTVERVETIYYVYVTDTTQKLLGVTSFRDLFRAPGHKKVSEIMVEDVISVPEDMDQEEISKLFMQHSLMAIPVVDEANRMMGIVTVDDIVQVVQEEATEDIQKSGGMEALDEPYLEIGLMTMIKKRAGWLAILFCSEMLTATAMGHFEDEIARAAVLATFIPLIISGGGNSGSQASTLVVRAMALSEVRLRDWWRVMRRELLTGSGLGLILGLLGFTRIMVWPKWMYNYGPHQLAIACTIACSVVGVVLFGSITGSMLPFLLRRLGLDPASASAPFVATLVDVSGLVIYFTVARLILSGILL